MLKRSTTFRWIKGVNTRNLSSQFKLAKSFRGGGMHNFVQAKQEINAIFGHLTKYLEACDEFLANYQIAFEDERYTDKFSSEVSGFLAQVSSISEIISRDQMKVAFFGRTSNGKSTTVNAMLQDKILPTGMGHTTNCFLSVHGSDLPDPYILLPGSDDKKDVKLLGQLAHALCKEKLDPSSLIQVFWPKSRCKMLSKDVVLVDSPGIDVNHDLDLWIDKHCLDADVFVLVVNAESTLTDAEKKFFRKVNQRLSRPNIFILNNRWDATALEPDMMELVKHQHLTGSISFLVDELQCVDKGQAEDRVFFVSAKETLMTRMQNHQGMPQGGGAIHVEGFPARQLEFENFEHKFEECITKSAIQTKFESHAVSGLKIANTLKVLMEQRVDSASQQRSKLEEIKKKQENRLKYVKEQLRIYTSDTERQIKEITSKVQSQVTEAMTEEIGRLGVLVNEFDHPFHPHPKFLETYKKELCNHIKSDLGRNMAACCSTFQTQVICEAQKEMADRLRSLLPETPEVSLEPGTPALDFQANFELDVPRLCTDFREDIEFRSSLGWQAISRKFLAPRNARLAIALGANIQRKVQSLVPTGPAVVLGLASPTISTGTLAVIVGGLIWKTVGWWFMALCGGVYSGVHVIERVCWTDGAKEKAFKRQFVDYFSEKLQAEVSVISAKCSGQVQQELTSTIAKRGSQVQREMKNLKGSILELYKEIERLKKMENDAKILRNEASRLESELSQFITEFGLEKSKM